MATLSMSLSSAHNVVYAVQNAKKMQINALNARQIGKTLLYAYAKQKDSY